MFFAWGIGVAAMAIYGVMTALWQALLVSLITNALFELGQVIWTTMLQQLVPRRLLGRVSSLDWMLSTGLVPLSFALTGPAADVIRRRSDDGRRRARRLRADGRRCCSCPACAIPSAFRRQSCRLTQETAAKTSWACKRPIGPTSISRPGPGPRTWSRRRASFRARCRR